MPRLEAAPMPVAGERKEELQLGVKLSHWLVWAAIFSHQLHRPTGIIDPLLSKRQETILNFKNFLYRPQGLCSGPKTQTRWKSVSPTD